MNDEKIIIHLDSLKRLPWGVTHYVGGLTFNGPPSVYQLGSDNGYGEPIKIAECTSDNEADFIARAPEYIEYLMRRIDDLEEGNWPFEWVVATQERKRRKLAEEKLNKQNKELEACWRALATVLGAHQAAQAVLQAEKDLEEMGKEDE